jgi:hypothetical protein
VFCLAFSPDSSHLAIGKNDGSVPLWDVAALRALAAPRPRKLNADELKALWDQLERRDSADAYKAANSLTAGGVDTVTFLAKHARPASVVDPTWIAEQVVKLDSDDSTTRQTAFTALEQVVDEAEPALKEALAAPTVSAEVRKRLEELLAIPGPVKSSQSLRRVRTVHILERIGSPAAADVLRQLAGGNPKAAETLDAKRALERMASRSRPE